MPRRAIIDLGTVTCRLMIGDLKPDGSPEVLYRSSEIVNLGEGVDANGYFLPEAMQRVDAAVASFVQTIDSFASPEEPVEVLAVGTSACRDSSNTNELIQMLAAHGVNLQVISGEQEAGFCFVGASEGRQGSNLLVVDVGGGSTELIAGRAGQAPFFVHSFDIGSRRITERFLHSDPPTASEIAKARAWCTPQFADYFKQLEDRGFRIDCIVAVAGTATSLVSIDKAMEVYDRNQVHNACITRETLDALGARLASLTLEQRKHVVGLQPKRADVIVGGIAILQSVLDAASASEFTVSECDLLQGALCSDRADATVG